MTQPNPGRKIEDLINDAMREKKKEENRKREKKRKEKKEKRKKNFFNSKSKYKDFDDDFLLPKFEFNNTTSKTKKKRWLTGIRLRIASVAFLVSTVIAGYHIDNNLEKKRYLERKDDGLEIIRSFEKGEESIAFGKKQNSFYNLSSGTKSVATTFLNNQNGQVSAIEVYIKKTKEFKGQLEIKLKRYNDYKPDLAGVRSNTRQDNSTISSKGSWIKYELQEIVELQKGKPYTIELEVKGSNKRKPIKWMIGQGQGVLGIDYHFPGSFNTREPLYIQFYEENINRKQGMYRLLGRK